MDGGCLENLNPQQLAAATFAADQPLLIVAGAGTGKTNTLSHRVAHLISTGIAPGRILLLTFTRRAAAEMIRRVESILMSLPPLVRWEYDAKQPAGSEEAALADWLRPRDWLSEPGA